jgi:hypothetical protein
VSPGPGIQQQSSYLPTKREDYRDKLADRPTFFDKTLYYYEIFATLLSSTMAERQLPKLLPTRNPASPGECGTNAQYNKELKMVALAILAIIVVLLTVDYFVQLGPVSAEQTAGNEKKK